MNNKTAIRVSDDIRNVVIKLGYEILGNTNFSNVLKAGTEEIDNLIALGILKPELDSNGKVSRVSYELTEWVDKYYPILNAPVDDAGDMRYRFGKIDENGVETGYHYKPYVKATYLFQQIQQPKKVIDIIRKQNKIAYEVWDRVLLHKRTNKTDVYDDKWQVETVSMAEAVSIMHNNGDHLAIYFGHQYDKRGRLYNDGYLLNYQGDEWSKAAIRPIIKLEKLTDRGMRAMRIDLANHFGYDKLTYDERLSADVSDLAKAKKPILAYRTKEFLESAEILGKTDYVCAIDATASGMQILSILANCSETAKVTNLTDLSQCYDIYGIACEKIIAKTGMTEVSVKDIRDIVKKALMTRGYNSDKQVQVAQLELRKFKINIGLSELRGILDISAKITKCKESMNNLLCDTFSKLPDDKQIIQYTMPDGFIVQFANIKKAMENCNGRLFRLNIKYDKLGWNKELNWRALSPNLVHSVDAYICRELIRRCQFTIVTIHDSFSCHPNNVDRLRLEYIKLLKEIQQMNMLDYIGKQLNSSYSWKPEGELFTIVESVDSYCLC